MLIVKKIMYYFERIQLIVAVISLLTIIVSITLGVIFRYFIFPLQWVEEIAILAFVWLSFFGASVAYYRKKHIVADFLVSLFSEKKQLQLRIIVYILVLCFLVIAAIATIRLVFESGHIMRSKTVIVGIPRMYDFLPLLIIWPYMAMLCVIDIIDSMVEYFTNQLHYKNTT